MKKLLALLLTLMLLPAAALAAEAPSFADRARGVCQALTGSEYAQIAGQFNENMRAVVDEALLEQSWAAVLAQMGAYEGIAEEQLNEANRTAVFTLQHEKGGVTLAVVFDDAGQISGLTLHPNVVYEPVQRALPEGASESEVKLFANSERETGGLLLRPAGADEETPYVVFVHGSGASDRDETVGPNKPFRDIAYDLAALGVGSLRFDKINYAHPELPVETVEQEYLQPVREALRVLKEETGARRVYEVGHSEGGILTPWLVRECGFDGGVALAGTPLPLWQMSYDQNLLSIAAMPEEQREALLAQVESERARAETLKEMTEEEARGQTVFGISAYYLRYMDLLDQVAIARESGKPYLFLWGEADFQVNGAAFEAWREGLGTDGPYAYKTYPGLSHLFLPAEEGDGIANAMDAYSRPAVVDPAVGRDIAEWIQSLAE